MAEWPLKWIGGVGLGVGFNSGVKDLIPAPKG